MLQTLTARLEAFKQNPLVGELDLSRLGLQALPEKNLVIC